MVKDHIGVTLMTGCEHYDLTNLRQLFQQFMGMRTDINSSINFLACWELYLQTDVIGHVCSLITMNECLVEVQDNGMFICGV